jgi:hypothetical protein
MSRFLRAATSALALASSFAFAREASAQMIIKNPGEHVKGGVELEPHLIVRPFNTPYNDFGLGLGFRASIPVTDNGFVSTINNNVAIGFGIDWMRYRGCSYIDCGELNHFVVPVVMQWNFFLTKAWSVYAEPGIGLNIYSGFNCDDYRDKFGRYRGGCYNDNRIDPLMFVGGRWHFSQYTTLTMRIGWPYWSVGVSFL